MKTFAVIAISLLVGLAAAAPSSSEEGEIIEVTPEVFIDELVVYTSQHDIVDILTPLNALNLGDDDDENDEAITFFFIEADFNNGVKDFKGLYAMKNKTAIKLLDHAKDFASSNEYNSVVYFAAEDGIYVFDDKNNKAVKYCSLEDNLIGITKVNGSDVLYVLNNKHELYKVSKHCEKKVKLDSVKNAQQIVLDLSNHLYFYAEDKKPYVLVGDALVKIEGLPENPSSVRLLRPAFITDDGVPFVSDEKVYIIYANGTSELTNFKLTTKPSAYSIETALINYYGYNKKIYEFNFMILLLGDILEEMKSFLSGKTSEIQNIASRSRETFGTSVINESIETTTKKNLLA